MGFATGLCLRQAICYAAFSGSVFLSIVLIISNGRCIHKGVRWIPVYRVCGGVPQTMVSLCVYLIWLCTVQGTGTEDLSEDRLVPTLGFVMSQMLSHIYTPMGIVLTW